MTIEQYLNQFIGDEVRGTSFIARYCFKGGNYAIAFNCSTLDECFQKVKDYHSNVPQDGEHILISEDPTGLWADEIVRLRLDVQR